MYTITPYFVEKSIAARRPRLVARPFPRATTQGHFKGTSGASRRHFGGTAGIVASHPAGWTGQGRTGGWTQGWRRVTQAWLGHHLIQQGYSILAGTPISAPISGHAFTPVFETELMAAFSNTPGRLFGLADTSGTAHADRHEYQCADQTRGWQSTPTPLSANRGGGHTPGVITHPASGHTTDSGTPRVCDPSVNTPWAGISRSCGQQGLAGNTIDALRYPDKIGKSMAGQSPSRAKNAAGRSYNHTPSIAQDQSSPPHPWLMANPGLIRSESASRNIRAPTVFQTCPGKPHCGKSPVSLGNPCCRAIRDALKDPLSFAYPTYASPHALHASPHESGTHSCSRGQVSAIPSMPHKQGWWNRQ